MFQPSLGTKSLQVPTSRENNFGMNLPVIYFVYGDRKGDRFTLHLQTLVYTILRGTRGTFQGFSGGVSGRVHT